MEEDQKTGMGSRFPTTDRIHPVQGPALPIPDLLQHGIGDAADQVRRHPQSVKLLEMRLDVAHRKPGGVEADELVIHSVDPGLAFLHQLRLKAAVPVARHRQRHLAIRALHPLRRGAIAAVGLFGWRFRSSPIAQVCGQFGSEHALHQPNLQFLH